MSTWIVPLLGTDFTEDFDKMLLDYIQTNYNIPDPLKTDIDHVRFAAGFCDFNEPFDYNEPYEIVITEPLNSTRREEEMGLAGRSNNMSTTMEINIRMERFSEDDAIRPQLGFMEREIIRIIGQYKDHNIVGIRNMIWEGGGRTYSEKDWRTQVLCRLYYEKRDIS